MIWNIATTKMCVVLLAAAALAVVPLVAAMRGENPAETELAAVQTVAPEARTYFIAADEMLWDYAPSDSNLVLGTALDGGSVIDAPDRIGKVYRKAIYREYTDSTFETVKPRPAEWEHLGFLGPLIRAQVGDTVRLVFRNHTRHPTSVHPHGVFYDKASEGAASRDGAAASESGDDAVPPGGTWTYVWPVPERAGPAEGDLSSVLWMYHSHVHEAADVNAGLMGPMIVTQAGYALQDGRPIDVDRELVVSFHEVDENASRYMPENMQRFLADPAAIDRSQMRFFAPFGNSNMMESMNGFVYGNLPGLVMREGERVRWYLMSSTNFEMHTPHWHGNTVVAHHMRTDMANLGSMGMVVAEMVPDNPGTWLFHCHVAPHLEAGMQAHYRVLPAETRTAAHRDGLPDIQ